MKPFILFFFAFIFQLNAQNYPLFGEETLVTINGIFHDAMEPHISPDGNALFFNNLNDGVETGIFYASKINDSTFSYLGPFPVVNQVDTPKLDAVASLDENDHFFWVSTRGYPEEMENLHHVQFEGQNYSNFGRVHGDIYVPTPGWIIMDAAIYPDGSKLLYCNAHFTTCTPMPCYSSIHLAEKQNDSTFLKSSNSDAILAEINHPDYINYAPIISADGLELYFTRALINTPNTEIMVAVRNDTLSPFSTPMLLDNSPFVPEGPTLTTDKQILYYHKKFQGVYRIFMRERIGTTSISSLSSSAQLTTNNPVDTHITLDFLNQLEENKSFKIISANGQLVLLHGLDKGNSHYRIDVSFLTKGIYFLKIGENTIPFVKN